MDRVEVIKAIVDADRRAREFPSGAKAELASLDETLKKERETMHEEFFARAEKRIDVVAATENEYANEMLRMLDARFQLDVRASKAAAEEHREEWTAELLNRILSAPLDR